MVRMAAIQRRCLLLCDGVEVERSVGELEGEQPRAEQSSLNDDSNRLTQSTAAQDT